MRAMSRIRVIWFVASAFIVMLSLVSAAIAMSANVTLWDVSGLAGSPQVAEADATGISKHGVGTPAIITANSSIVGTTSVGPSGLVYWNPTTNLFLSYVRPIGYPGAIAINRNGPVTTGGPFNTSFGPGDVWVGGQSNAPLYVHMAGTDYFRDYASYSYGVLPPTSKVWGVAVDPKTGDVFFAQPWEGRVGRLHPQDGMATVWQMIYICNGPYGPPAFCGNPINVIVDSAGRPYASVSYNAYGDSIMRVNPGLNGLGSADDTLTFWPFAPPGSGFERFGSNATTSPAFPQSNVDGITIDADGNIWFVETQANKIGRLNPSTNALCEYTTSGVNTPQLITTTGSTGHLQAYFTESSGNSMSILTQAEADLATSPTRVCTTVTPVTISPTLWIGPAFKSDEQVSGIMQTIGSTSFAVAGSGTGASGTTKTASGEFIPPILRFPMPNFTSVGGVPVYNSSVNGLPSGLTSVYSTNVVAGTYLRTQKVFQFANPAIIYP